MVTYFPLSSYRVNAQSDVTSQTFLGEDFSCKN